MRRFALQSLAPFVFAATVAAQSFNVDFGSNPSYAGAPTTSYGGAAGQPGVWNSITAPSASPTLLEDLGGVPTTVAVTCTGGSVHDFDTMPAVGVNGALLGDWFETSGSSFNVTLSGLANGWYDVFTYAAVLDVECSLTEVNVSGSVDPAQQVRMPTVYPGDLAPGLSHARHRIQVSGGTFTISLTALQGSCLSAGYAGCNGLQIVPLDGAYASLCSGDGSGTACPCGNSGSAGRGCANSFEPQGAMLACSGVASVSADSMVLSGVGVSNSVVTFFQGTQAVQAGFGAVFGDGLRCAGGTTIRLGAKLASANAASYPGALDVPVSLRGLIPATGATRLYQCWYRNAAAFCTTSTFNLSNAVRVQWMP
jgi:hypothetical protein